MSPQPSENSLIAVALVSSQALRPQTRAPEVNGVERCLDALRLVVLSGRYVRGEGKGAAVTDQVDLGPKPAS